jgi:hypothetical protein
MGFTEHKAGPNKIIISRDGMLHHTSFGACIAKARFSYEIWSKLQNTQAMPLAEFKYPWQLSKTLTANVFPDRDGCLSELP